MKSFDVSCPYCDESLSVTSGDMGFDVTCPTCNEDFFIEKETLEESKKNVKEPTKLNLPKKHHQKKTKETFVVENWMLYAGYYVALILIPIIMLALGTFFGWTAFSAAGLLILGFGVMNLANSLSLYLGMQVCRVGCEVPAIILMSLIASLWGTFVGPGGLIIFLFLFSKYTDASIMDAIGTVICSSIISFFVYLGLMGVIVKLASG